MANNNQTVESKIAKLVSENPSMRLYLQQQLYMKDFMAYVEKAWGLVEPGVPFSKNWHLEYLAEEIMSMFGDILHDVFPDADWEKINSETTRRMCVNVPTRSMKTLLISVFFPTWIVLHKPTLKVATVSYSKDLATEINTKKIAIITSHWYQELFGHLVTVGKEDTNRKELIEFSSKGNMYSTSIEGTFTGKGADIIILDDPQKPGEMGTPSQREKAIKFFDETLQTRLNDLNKGVIINVQQRLHSEDLTGHIRKKMGDGYQYITIPLLFEEKRTFIGPLTGRKWVAYEDDPLWEARFNRKSIELLRRSMGAQLFEAQQQQNPTPEGGSIIKSKEWFKEYDGGPIDFLNFVKRQDPEAFANMILYQSWDMAYADSNKSDFVGLIVSLYDPSKEKLYILEASEKRASFNESLTTVVNTKARYELDQNGEPLGIPIQILIEEKANGGPIIQILDSKVSGIIPINPGRIDKVARLSAVSGFIESGDVFLPSDEHKAPWKEKFLRNILGFPYLDHDDMVDAFSQTMVHAFVNSAKASKQTYGMWY